MVLFSVLYNFKRPARKTSLAHTTINTMYIYPVYDLQNCNHIWLILIYTNIYTNKYTNTF